MAHHHEETRAAELEIQVSVYDRIAAYFLLGLILLHGILPEGGGIFWSCVFGEIPRICTEVTIKHTSYLESQVQIGICID